MPLAKARRIYIQRASPNPATVLGFYCFVCASVCVCSYHNARWLIQQRANFSTGGRNSLLAGRTGTRLNIGRPQTRWEAGYETSVQMLGHRTSNERSSNMLSVGTIFREARAVLGLL